MEIIYRFGSRKFLFTLGTVLTIVGTLLTGNVSPVQGIAALLVAVGTYVAGESYVDGKAVGIETYVGEEEE